MGLPQPPPLGSSPLPPGCYAGQSVVVTGGGTGLGRAIALEFARLGAAVAIWSRGEEHRRAGVVAVEAEGARALGVACDVRDPAAVAAAFDATEAALGLPDVLVNNAAGNFPVPAEDLSPNGFRSVVEIVLHGTFHCAREFGRRHLAAGRPGSILNVGASYAWTGGPGFAHSAAAKAGVKNLTETLAVEWGPYGIRVNGIVPGLVPHEDEVAAIRGVPGREPRDGPGGAGTPRSEAPGGAGEDARAPAGRVGAPREIGWAAVFLASPWAAYVSGHSFVVDGANWQRRAMLQPPFEPIREQLGHGPFSLAPPPAGGRPKP